MDLRTTYGVFNNFWLSSYRHEAKKVCNIFGPVMILFWIQEIKNGYTGMYT